MSGKHRAFPTTVVVGRGGVEDWPSLQPPVQRAPGLPCTAAVLCWCLCGKRQARAPPSPAALHPLPPASLDRTTIPNRLTHLRHAPAAGPPGGRPATHGAGECAPLCADGLHGFQLAWHAAPQSRAVPLPLRLSTNAIQGGLVCGVCVCVCGGGLFKSLCLIEQRAGNFNVRPACLFARMPCEPDGACMLHVLQPCFSNSQPLTCCCLGSAPYCRSPPSGVPRRQVPAVSDQRSDAKDSRWSCSYCGVVQPVFSA